MSMRVRQRIVVPGRPLNWALLRLDRKCFPDCQETIPDFDQGITVVAYEGGRAYEDENVFGYGHMTDEGYIDRICMHPNFQRQGTATRILRSLISHARKQELPRVYTYTSRSNVASIMLFLTADFMPVTTPRRKSEWWYWEIFL